MKENSQGQSGGPPAPNSLGELLRKYLGPMHRVEKRQYLRDHPALLSPEADSLLAVLSANQKTEGARSIFERARSELKGCREQGVEQALPDEAESGSPNMALVRTLSAFMGAGSLEAMKGIARQHPELLGPETDALLRNTGDDRTARHLEKYRRLLDLCRQIGVDAAFAEAERQAHQGSMPREVLDSLLKVVTAKNPAELEQAIRGEPRVMEHNVRTMFSAFLAQQGTFGIPMEQIQQRLGFLQECEKNGMDATFARMARPVPPTAGADEAFNSVIRKFNRGGEPLEIARECLSLMPMLPEVPRRSCLLLAMLASHRSGNNAQARQLAVRLHQQASGWDLPGIPGESLGVAVKELRDVTPILSTLESMRQTGGITPPEQEVIQSLLKQYSERKEGPEDTEPKSPAAPSSGPSSSGGVWDAIKRLVGGG